MLKWYEEKNSDSDVIISSRIRLARNLREYPFAVKLQDEKAKELVEDLTDHIELSKEENPAFHRCKLSNLSEVDKNAMVERHIVSPLLATKKQETGLIVSEDESISVMINEEDHLRIQSIISGMNLEKAYEKANEVDDMISDKYTLAYDEKYGYLTSCPTNVGTGLRASYMCFLPALTGAGMIVNLVEELGRYGITIRGIYGEESRSIGNLYQISNEKTLGRTESDIIENLNSIIIQIMKQERKRREYMLTNNYNEIEDQIYRAYGILRYTKQITSSDSMAFLSLLKLGIDAGILKPKKDINVFQMMMDVQPASLQYKMGKNAGSTLRNRFRAEYINNCLDQII